MRPEGYRISARRRGDLARELVDYFCHEPGAVRSNYASIAALALSGVRTSGGKAFGDDYAIAHMHRIHRAVRHYETIRGTLRLLSEEHRTVLWLAFGPHRWPPEIRKTLGETAGAALRTMAAREGCRKAAGASKEPSLRQVGAWLLARAVASDATAFVSVITERDEIVDVALIAYGAAKRERAPKPRNASSGSRRISKAEGLFLEVDE